ncbi:SIR2 family protein [Agreia sp. Leaf244]|uniref:SIR2 family protein n=1 Tax=Agreia sp. Leaf244 TaxID=1736305 RepID=UPI0009E6E0B0|nr:SIR2 family protein [Agreia sp. Leaf244]
MFITEGVDLPGGVVEAHAAGKLVFFVGAGASIDSPSDLPSFTKLASDLADAAKVSFDEDIAIDLFLGSMPNNFDVHSHALRLIAPPSSAPNATHRALVRLASAIGPARIVTTNFDSHITSAADSEGLALGDRWIGPALPLGDRFSGVVHLHGSTTRAARDLVLTDRDFGRAYLTDAWATRFLQRMFEKFTVLFIGYSLDDPIMRYLSLGLPSKTKRYVLTHKPDDAKWSHLGIQPVSYPSAGGDHSALLAALDAWNVRARMGLLDHSAQMRDIVDGGPTMTPVDRDYVVRRLRTIDGANDFARLAHTVDWLEWAEGEPQFKALFAGGAVDEPTSVLADWFGHFVVDPDLHGAALQTIQRLGQRLSPVLINAVLWSIAHLSRADEEAGRQWKTLFSTSIDGYSTPPNPGLMMPHRPTGRPENLNTIRAALRPVLHLKASWYPKKEDRTAPPDAVVSWRTRYATISAHLRLAIAETDAGDQVLGSLLEDALNQAYDLLEGYHGDRKFDLLSFRRSAVEDHPQDSRRDLDDAIIDALRDFGFKALPVVRDLPERWWAQRRVLFRRLAIHLVIVDTFRRADEKIVWLLERDLLYSANEKHEVFRALHSVLPDASVPLLQKVLTVALLGPRPQVNRPEQELHRARASYDLLAWFTKALPGWVEAKNEFEKAQAANPDFQVREHPDHTSWISSGSSGGHLPIDPRAFIEDAENDLSKSFTDLVDGDYSGPRFDAPTWDDALAVVEKVVEARPELGSRMWDIVNERSNLEGRAVGLRNSIIAGWERADLNENAAPVTALISSMLGKKESVDAICRFLLSRIEKLVDGDETTEVVALRELARAVWIKYKTDFEHPTNSSPSSLALNSWPGHLVSFWTVEIDRRWRQDRDGWGGLNADESSALVAILSGPPSTLEATRPAMASSIFFLFAADPDFAELHILPLFGEESSSLQMWGSFLYHPRTDDRMLRAGLLEATIMEWNWLDELDGLGLADQFYDFVAAVVSFGGIQQVDRQQLLDAAVLANNGSHAAHFASAVVRLLESPGVIVAEVWDRWLRDHLYGRLAGLPRDAQPEELARWLDCIPFLEERVPEAIKLVHGRSIGLGDHYQAPEIPRVALSAFGPELVLHLSERIRNSAPISGILAQEVRDLIEDLESALGALAQPLIDAATESGVGPTRVF